MKRYSGIDYNKNTDGRIQYTQLNGCYFDVGVYNRLPTEQQELAFSWLRAIFQKRQMMHENETIVIHSLYSYGLIIPDDEADTTINIDNEVLSLDTIAAAYKDDNKIIRFLTECFVGDIMDDRFMFVRNTLKRNACIEDVEIADRKRKVGSML